MVVGGTSITRTTNRRGGVVRRASARDTLFPRDTRKQVVARGTVGTIGLGSGHTRLEAFVARGYHTKVTTVGTSTRVVLRASA